ncbi:MAG: IS66 family insertion sequence element accessory protein TnpB [Acidobacteriota bacterium]
MIGTELKLWLCTVPADMRNSYNGLGALVRRHFDRAPSCGDGFIFLNRRRTQLKCLYFDRGGYCIWSKRLERGQYARLRSPNEGPMALSTTQFAALVEGFDVVIRRRRKRATRVPKYSESVTDWLRDQVKYATF